MLYHAKKIFPTSRVDSLPSCNCYFASLRFMSQLSSSLPVAYFQYVIRTIKLASTPFELRSGHLMSKMFKFNERIKKKAQAIGNPKRKVTNSFQFAHKQTHIYDMHSKKSVYICHIIRSNVCGYEHRHSHLF